MRLTVIPIPATLPNGVLFTSRQLRQVVDVARQAEALGIDDVALSEHVLMANHPESYPYGPYPHSVSEPWPDPIAVLAAMAAVTERVRLITGIIIAPLRPAGLLAKQAATLDALSNGRFVLGVSTSWQAEEYQALNAPFADRGLALTEWLGACRALWGSEHASYHGQYVNFDDMVCEPRPANVDDIKVWLGGALTPRLVKRVAQYGHGWMPFVGLERKPLEKMAEGRKRLEDALQAAGRDPTVLEISPLVMPRGRDLATTLEQDVPRFQAAGATGIRVQISTFISDIERVPDFLAEIAERFQPYRT